MQEVAKVEALKKKKDDAYRKCGLDINEQLHYENMPRDIQKAEQNYSDAVNFNLMSYYCICRFISSMILRKLLRFNKSTQTNAQLISIKGHKMFWR